MFQNQQRLENLLVSPDFSTFSVLQSKLTPPVGAVQEETQQKPIGTDLDEYNRWTESQGGSSGIGDIIYDDHDDARDAAEFTHLTGVDQSTSR